MARYDARRELAPRDVVARSIVREMASQRLAHVWLDATGFPPGEFARRFPTIHAHCLLQGCDPEREPIPVSPAAHYLMGGVWTDVWGRTSVPGLYACGETAATGVHGANRLASNSLLEGVVFGSRVAEAIADGAATAPRQWPDTEMLTLDARTASASLSRESLRTLMWDDVGILRHGAGLGRAVRPLASCAIAPPAAGVESHETSNLALVGWVMAEAARRREESRGAHHRLDFPEPHDAWRRRQLFTLDAGGSRGARSRAAAPVVVEVR
jgi:L-aspartate oxidase